jgi:branched-chain amino acid transport system ATP-binding protein
MLRAISGTLPITSGAIRLDGRRIDGRSTYAIASGGITLIPEGRGVFPGLNVRENLAIAARAGNRRQRNGANSERIDEVTRIFPRLAERSSQRAATLSGGEQQMLAMARAFLASPTVLLLDEISMGLAPIIVEQLFAFVARLKAAGMTIVLVEQYLTYALGLADVCYMMNKGRITFVGEPAELMSNASVASAYLGSDVEGAKPTEAKTGSKSAARTRKTTRSSARRT